MVIFFFWGAFVNFGGRLKNQTEPWQRDSYTKRKRNQPNLRWSYRVGMKDKKCLKHTATSTHGKFAGFRALTQIDIFQILQLHGVLMGKNLRTSEGQNSISCSCLKLRKYRLISLIKSPKYTPEAQGQSETDRVLLNLVSQAST